MDRPKKQNTRRDSAVAAQSAGRLRPVPKTKRARRAPPSSPKSASAATERSSKRRRASSFSHRAASSSSKANDFVSASASASAPEVEEAAAAAASASETYDYRVNDYILVKHDSSRSATFGSWRSQWVAQILRFPSREKVKVAWLDKPEDDPSGRLPHHGENELILTGATNVISVLSINGKVPVVAHPRDEEEAVDPEALYFRQSRFGVDEDGDGLLPRLPVICVEGGCRNPDVEVVKCPDGSCGYAHHRSCVERKLEEVKEGMRIRGHWSMLQVSSRGVKKVICYRCKKVALVLRGGGPRGPGGA